MPSKPECTKERVDELVRIITDPHERYDRQSRALHELEQMATVVAKRIEFGVTPPPEKPSTLPEVDTLELVDRR